MSENVELKKGFSQVCVWPGCIVGPDKIKHFEQTMIEKFNTRVQYLEEIDTKPDLDGSGNPVPDTGGRTDLFFAVHTDDIMHFAVPRLAFGIRWIEDVLANCNYRNPLYPQRVFDYKTWDADEPEVSEDE